jgi:hypothetical protein
MDYKINLMNEHLRWELRTNGWVQGEGDLLAWVEAETEKWRYEVHPDWNIEGRWVAWRQFRSELSDYDLGELWDDELDTFEAALRRAQQWHDERDSD